MIHALILALTLAVSSDPAPLPVKGYADARQESLDTGKPVLVMRETTERPEGVVAGTARLVGTDPARIVSEIFTLLDDKHAYAAMARAHNPFGDGTSAQRIMELIANAG